MSEKAEKPQARIYCCGTKYAPVQRQVMLRRGVNDLQVLGSFHQCIRCGKVHGDLQIPTGSPLTQEEFREAKRLNIFTLEDDGHEGLRPYINEYLRSSALGQEVLKKKGVEVAPPKAEPAPEDIVSDSIEEPDF